MAEGGLVSDFGDWDMPKSEEFFDFLLASLPSHTALPMDSLPVYADVSFKTAKSDTEYMNLYTRYRV